MADQSRKQPTGKTQPKGDTKSKGGGKGGKGTPKPPRSRQETQARLNRIVELRHIREETWPVIAADVGMTERACKLAFAQWKSGAREALLSEDMLDVVQRKLDSIKGVRKSLLTATEAALRPELCKECGKECGHIAKPGVVVGAARATLEADVAELHSRQIVGLMPRNMADLRGLVDARRIMQTVAQVLLDSENPKRKHDRAHTQAMLHAIREQLEASQPLVLLPGSKGTVIEQEPLELEA